MLQLAAAQDTNSSTTLTSLFNIMKKEKSAPLHTVLVGIPDHEDPQLTVSAWTTLEKAVSIKYIFFYCFTTVFDIYYAYVAFASDHI